MRLWVLAAVVFGIFVPTVALAQLSPGPLTKSHANLEGVTQCSKCHAFGTGRQEFKCSSCHLEILERVKTQRGYHARVADGAKGDADCVTCHKEHVARDFELIRWPRGGQAAFDHSQAGYRLEGSHTALQCSQCHNAKRIPSAKKAGILMKDLDRSFLGLETTCLSCHTDTHRGRFGTNCSSCHSQSAWKPVTKFDHTRTRFPLTGLHASVTCQQCHGPAPGSTAARYTNLNFSDCSGCHRDPHGGKFAGSCSGCHSTGGWKVPKGTLTSRFDHSRTRYPLTGKHSSVECASCHRNSNFGVRVAHALCIDCHRDEHDGQFAKRMDRGDCGACHTLNGFARSTFDVKAHLTTKYPLMGKHAQVACVDCHEKKGSFTNYHPKAESCTDCHQDVHDRQFVARYANRCETCHNVDGFTPSTFTLVRHRQTRFDLGGAHVAVACTDCHKQSRPRAPHQYVFEQRSCVTCHRDPHELAAQQKQCEACHTVNAWIPALGFDHSNTRFTLLGSHRAVDCLSCHKPKTTAAVKLIPFKGAPEHCLGCHEDIHAGQFAKRQDTGNCASCHSTLEWQPPTGFDHSQTAFPLDGAHEKVRCVLCHTTTLRVNGRQVVNYKEAPTECAKCH